MATMAGGSREDSLWPQPVESMDVCAREASAASASELYYYVTGFLTALLLSALSYLFLRYCGYFEQHAKLLRDVGTMSQTTCVISHRHKPVNHFQGDYEVSGVYYKGHRQVD